MSPSQKHPQEAKLVSPGHSKRIILNAPEHPPTSLHGSSRNMSADHRPSGPLLAIKNAMTRGLEGGETMRLLLPTEGETMTTSTSTSKSRPHKLNVEHCATFMILLQLQTNQVHRLDGHRRLLRIETTGTGTHPERHRACKPCVMQSACMRLPQVPQLVEGTAIRTTIARAAGVNHPIKDPRHPAISIRPRTMERTVGMGVDNDQR
jgi:hypothetical protein